MSPPQLSSVVYLCIAIAASLAIALYAWGHPRMRGRKAFVCGTIASVLWMLGSVLGRLSGDFSGQYIAEVVRGMGVTTLPIWVFAFSRAYCGKPLRRRWLFALSIVPALSFLVMATTFWTRWYFHAMSVGLPGAPHYGELAVKFGPYFWWVHLPYSYALTLLSLLLVITETWRVPRPFRGQIFYLFIALMLPVIVDAASLLGLWKGYRTAFVLPVFPIMMWVAMFRHDILGLTPVAYESIVQNISESVIILDRQDVIIDINEAATRHVGATRRAIVGQRLQQVFGEWPELLARCLNQTELITEIAHRNNGATQHYGLQIFSVLGIDNQVEARTIMLRDVTDSKNYQNSLEIMAFYDPLTHLANRRKFEQEIDKILRTSTRNSQEFAILYFDLNRFKTVNDNLGHEFGDELLRCVGRRTSEILRAPDFAARLGGDEFVVLLHDITRADIELVAARLLAHVQQPFSVGDHILLPQLSMGATFYPCDGSDLKTLLRRADAAMYRAKADGGGLALSTDANAGQLTLQPASA